MIFLYVLPLRANQQAEKVGGKLLTFEEMLLYLDILHAQGAHQVDALECFFLQAGVFLLMNQVRQVALDAVRDDNGSAISLPQDRALLQAHCLVCAGRLHEAANTYKVLSRIRWKIGLCVCVQ